jgi:dihydrolipoamide dehydrogenase
MAESQSFDLVVVGGGPGGYVAAIRAAQLGMSVACVERDRLGGVCLNWGCIPTKALLAGAELYHKVKHQAGDWGIEVGNVSHNWEKVIGRSRGVADQLNRGIHGLFKKNKITHFEGHAHIPAKGQVDVYEPDDPQRAGQTNARLEARHIMIATGAAPRSVPGAEFDGETVIASKEAMTLKEQPERLLVVGAGAIGMEFAYFYNAFGTEVTVVELMDRVLPIEDAEVSKAISKAFKKQGITLKPGHKTTSIEKGKKGVTARIAKADDASKTETIEADKVLLAVGVAGRYDGLFDESLGIETDKDHIKVDTEGGTYQTSVEGIYAIGDVIGPPWLAHVASEEGVVCVERLAGENPPAMDYGAIPANTYCHPQVASIGLTEEQCQEKGLDYEVGHFPHSASGMNQALGETAGFTRMITDKQYGEVLGCHMVGDNVTELIAEMGLGKRLETTAEEIIATVHAHPTRSEAVHEAALGTEGRMIHF